MRKPVTVINFNVKISELVFKELTIDAIDSVIYGFLYHIDPHGEKFEELDNYYKLFDIKKTTDIIPILKLNGLYDKFQKNLGNVNLDGENIHDSYSWLLNIMEDTIKEILFTKENVKKLKLKLKELSDIEKVRKEKEIIKETKKNVKLLRDKGVRF